MKRSLYHLTHWIAQRKAPQALVPAFFRLGGWLLVGLYQLVGVYALLLTTAGRKTGKLHTVALVGHRLGPDYAVVSPFGPGGRYPDWYLNLKNNPQATVEIMWRKRPVVAVEVLDEAERTTILRAYGAGVMDLEGAQGRAGTQFPVIRLRRA
jgi:deazaflavin-dependent oxidoreductase (nitroreductase family)